MTLGHSFSAQTWLLCRPFPAVHVQHRVQENSSYVFQACIFWEVQVVLAVPHLLICRLSSVKPSPSKKSRGGGQGGLRRAPTLGGPTPLSHATGQPGVDSKLVYHSHFKSTDSEAESGKNCGLTSEVTQTFLWFIVLVVSTATSLSKLRSVADTVFTECE